MVHGRVGQERRNGTRGEMEEGKYLDSVEEDEAVRTGVGTDQGRQEGNLLAKNGSCAGLEPLRRGKLEIWG